MAPGGGFARAVEALIDAVGPVFGSARGRVHLRPDFDAPLPEMAEYEA